MSKICTAHRVGERSAVAPSLDRQKRSLVHVGLDVDATVDEGPEARGVIQGRDDLARLGNGIAEARRAKPVGEIFEQRADGASVDRWPAHPSAPS